MKQCTEELHEVEHSERGGGLDKEPSERGSSGPGDTAGLPAKPTIEEMRGGGRRYKHNKKMKKLQALVTNSLIGQGVKLPGARGDEEQIYADLALQ